ncbi:hypothetical protein D3C86_1489290 [compost metagenome]
MAWLYELGYSVCFYSYSSDRYIQVKIIIDQGITQVFKEIARTESHFVFGAVYDQLSGCNQYITVYIQGSIKSYRMSDALNSEVALNVLP